MSNARISLGTVCVGIGVMLSACTPPSENWQRTQILSGLPVHGLQGLNFGPDGALYIGSVMSEAVMRLDVETGRMTQSVGPPLGEADDVAFGPDGTMAWTALNQGALRVRTPAGEIESVAEVGARRVLTIDPVSGVTQLLADGLALGGSISRAPDPIAMPTGLAVDASGAVWVVTDGDNGLVKLTPP